MLRTGLFVLAIFLTACVTRVVTRVQFIPMVRTIEVPYTAAFPLDTTDKTDTTTLGSTGCDMNGQPYIMLRPGLTKEHLGWVVEHERIHVRQMLWHPRGCMGFIEEYTTDDVFRVRAEGEAYCEVYQRQKFAKTTIDPTLEGFVAALLAHYQLDDMWSTDSIRALLPCKA